MKNISVSISIVLVAMAVLGCNAHKTIGSGDPYPIPFDLIIPGTISQGDFFGISGVSVITQKTIVGDSLIDAQFSSFYTQFTTSPGTALPSTVKLNSAALEHNLDTDTLRLGGVGADLSKTHIWTLADSGSQEQKFQISTVSMIDSVSPFPFRTVVRGDTALRIQWQPAPDGGVGMMIIWKLRDRPFSYTQNLNDFAGSTEIPREVMTQLVGDGTIYLVRYRTASGTFRGKSVVLARTSQRSYNVTVIR